METQRGLTKVDNHKTCPEARGRGGGVLSLEKGTDCHGAVAVMCKNC